jgi:hypothetical protein
MSDHGAFVRDLPHSTDSAKVAAPAAGPKVSFTLRYERGETSA